MTQAASNVLLLGADYYGTLAAARVYGRRGLRVAMADERASGRALHSRYVSERLVHPPLARPAALVDWLVDYGRRRPGTFLYPTNDHLAWLFAAEGARLREVFSTYQPEERTILALLDKSRLHEACEAVGIDVPATKSAADAGALGFPVLVKPRTQVYLESGIKGFIAQDRRELDAELARFERLVKFNPYFATRHPEVTAPMVQEYLTAAETSIFSVSGFVTESGALVTRAAMKVLQRPRKVGIGLCFESRALEPAITEKLVALCKHVGYFGAFESEFIADGERRLLIDFNPRFYSQMAFDVARGMDLPGYALLGAEGRREELEDAMRRASADGYSADDGYCHKTMLELVLTLQGLSGKMSRSEVRNWRRWVRARDGSLTDAVRDRDDPRPALVDAAAWARHFARYPRSFVRQFVLNR